MGKKIANNWLKDASLTEKGIIQIASQSEVDAGTDNSKVVTPMGLKNFSDLPVTVPVGYSYSSLALIKAGVAYTDESGLFDNTPAGGGYCYYFNHNINNPNLVRGLTFNAIGQITLSNPEYTATYARDAVGVTFDDTNCILVISSVGGVTIYKTTDSPITINDFPNYIRVATNAKVTNVVDNSGEISVTLTYTPGWIGFWTYRNFGLFSALRDIVVNIIHD